MVTSLRSGIFVVLIAELNIIIAIKAIIAKTLIIFFCLKKPTPLSKISFGEKHEHRPGELHYERKIAFALGGVSMVSWYSAFILGMLRKAPFDFSSLLLIYFLLLVGAIIGSQFMERFFIKRANLS